MSSFYSVGSDLKGVNVVLHAAILVSNKVFIHDELQQVVLLLLFFVGQTECESSKGNLLFLGNLHKALQVSFKVQNQVFQGRLEIARY